MQNFEIFYFDNDMGEYIMNLIQDLLWDSPILKKLYQF